jgi:hypothetical protein
MSSELGKLIQQPARNEHFPVLVLKAREDLGCLTVYKILIEKKAMVGYQK